jgi:predicted nucleic acid-binding protein
MKVVVNATPLIGLALINRLELLPALFEDVIVPRAVYEEVALHGSGRAGAAALTQATWVQVREPDTTPTIEPLLLGLDAGELQVLLLARTLQPDWVLVDERLGRRVAQALQLPVKGTVGVLLAAFHAELLTKTKAREAVQQLREQGFRISPEVLAWFDQELEQS